VDVSQGAQNFTVTFNPSGGVVSPTSRVVASGSPIGTLPIPTRAGHTFAGWFDSPGGVVPLGAVDIDILDDMLMGGYDYEYMGADYTIFDIDIGENEIDENVIDGTQSIEAASAATAINSSFIVRGNVTLFARWNAQTVTVTFNLNGGVLVVPAPLPSTIPVGTTWGTSVGPLPRPTRAGYQFAGWFSAQTEGQRVDEQTIINNDITIFARWIVTVTFNPAGGIISTSDATRQTIGGNALGFLPGTPRRTGPTFGHRFDGWFTALHGGNRVTHTRLVPNEHVTYYGQWLLNTDPARHLDYWTHSNSITIRPAEIHVGSVSEWERAIGSAISGVNSWTNSSAPVSFAFCSGSENRVIVDEWRDRSGYLGWMQPWLDADDRTEIIRFDVTLHAYAINRHVTNRSYSLRNVATSIMVHELGHSIGLRNIYRGSSAMNVNRSRNTVMSPTQFDIDSVRMIYD